jgi:t-SNARE complex subunit (syntaxin)
MEPLVKYPKELAIRENAPIGMPEEQIQAAMAAYQARIAREKREKKQRLIIIAVVVVAIVVGFLVSFMMR